MSERHILLKGKIEELGLKREGKDHWWITGAIIREGLGTLTDMTVEFVTGREIDLKALVGQPMAVEVEDRLARKTRSFNGICVSLECIGRVRAGNETHFHHVAKVRHWLWMLTRTSDNRIFQDMTTPEIIKKVFSDHGFNDFDLKLREQHSKRDYCVQYRETDFDFLSRLMQEDGIYYYYDTSVGQTSDNKLIICNDATFAHPINPGTSRLSFTSTGGREADAGDKVTDWSFGENVISGAVTLNDYEMRRPSYSHSVVTRKTEAKASHGHKGYELYHYPGRYRDDSGLGQWQAQVRMQAEEVRAEVRRGATNSRSMATGFTFRLSDAYKEDGEYLVTEAVHYIRPTEANRIDAGRLEKGRSDLAYPEEMGKTDYVCYFSAIPRGRAFRSPLTVPWPEIAGLHTAVVVGKKGEEIWTDEHGRIKVQFHWDRLGKKDENSSCWIRVATPWSGKDWGLVAIPRMGQEVVIQFEEGNPDRPICTGMLWNAETRPAFKYPDDAAQLGIRSRSTKSGGDRNYNELMFEDKKGKEMMRVQAEKDHQALIKNKSVVTIGRDAIDAGDHDDEGSLSEVIRNHVTRTIQEGNHYHTIAKGDEEFRIETGSQHIEIKTDKTQKVEGKHTQEITGNYETKVTSGDHLTTVSTGNMDVKVSAGKVTMTAAQSIELKVGPSSIKIDPSGVTIKGPMIKVQATAMAEVKSPMTTVKGDAMLTLKGGITMIN